MTPHDILILMTSLSRLTDADQVRRLFVEAVSEMLSPRQVRIGKARDESDTALPLKTLLGDYGQLIIEAGNSLPESDLQLIQTAVQLLAVQLENLAQQAKEIGLERNRADRYLERLEHVLKGTSDAPWDWDLVTDELWYSDHWWRQIGYAPDELPADSTLRKRLMHPDDYERVTGFVEDAFCNGTETYEIEFRLRHKDGHYVPVLSRGFIKRVDGKPVRISGANTDLTERKQAEQQLRDSEAKLRSVLDDSPFPIAVVDENDDRIEYWSRSARDLFGHTPTSAAEWYAVAYPDPEYQKEVLSQWKPKVEEARATGRPVNTGEYRVTCADGSVRICQIYAHFVPGNLIVTLNDVTDRHEMESHLRQVQKLESIGTLAGGVAHEINNPINGIMNYAQLIKDRTPTESATVAFIDEILKETDRVAGLVRNLLAFSRQQPHEHEVVDLAEIVEESLSLIRTILMHDQIELVVDLPGDLPQLHCHRQQIQQVLMNLVTNARDALNEDSSENKRIVIRAHEVDIDHVPQVHIEVEDNGPGIPESIRKRVFDPFFTTKTRTQGTGLGLAISYGIITDHRGRICFRTTPGEGTIFTIDLPTQQAKKHG